MRYFNNKFSIIAKRWSCSSRTFRHKELDRPMKNKNTVKKYWNTHLITVAYLALPICRVDQ